MPVRSLVLLILIFAPGVASSVDCVACHTDQHVDVVSSWMNSAHREADVDCVACHADEHDDATNVDQVMIPGPSVCASCHDGRLEQYRAGKHGAAWIAMRTFTVGHGSALAEHGDPDACSTCHLIGTKPVAETRSIDRSVFRYGRTSCDTCHARHAFSVDEARSVDACTQCHRGVGHAQAEIFATSVHGRLDEDVPAEARGPSCQSCHMVDGDHEVRTAWGFYGVRWPLESIAAVDSQWAMDQRAIQSALGMVDANDEPTWRFTAAQVLDMFRMDDDAFTRERERMVDACAACHEREVVTEELDAADDFLRAADRLMAAAIEVVRELFDDGVLVHDVNDGTWRPDLFEIRPSSPPIEIALARMFFEHRANAFMGRFHGSDDYAVRRGVSAMEEELRGIEAMAERMRSRR